MPYKHKHPCGVPGCPNLTDGQYCEEHALEQRRKYDRYERDPDVHKTYGRGWTRIRNRYMVEHPYCEQCYAEGRMVMATECHHIIPVNRGGTHDTANLKALCQSCHNKVHHELGDR